MLQGMKRTGILMIFIIAVILTAASATIHASESSVAIDLAYQTDKSVIGEVPQAMVFDSRNVDLTVTWHRDVRTNHILSLSGAFQLQTTHIDDWDPVTGYTRVRSSQQGLRGTTMRWQHTKGNPTDETIRRLAIQIPGPQGRLAQSLWNLPTEHGAIRISTEWMWTRTRDPVVIYGMVAPTIPLSIKTGDNWLWPGKSIRLSTGIIHALTREVSVGGSVDVGFKAKDRLGNDILHGTQDTWATFTPTLTYAPSLESQIEIRIAFQLDNPEASTVGIGFRWLKRS